MLVWVGKAAYRLSRDVFQRSEAVTGWFRLLVMQVKWFALSVVGLTKLCDVLYPHPCYSAAPPIYTNYGTIRRLLRNCFEFFCVMCLYSVAVSLLLQRVLFSCFSELVGPKNVFRSILTHFKKLLQNFKFSTDWPLTYSLTNAFTQA